MADLPVGVEPEFESNFLWALPHNVRLLLNMDVVLPLGCMIRMVPNYIVLLVSLMAPKNDSKFWIFFLNLTHCNFLVPTTFCTSSQTLVCDTFGHDLEMQTIRLTESQTVFGIAFLTVTFSFLHSYRRKILNTSFFAVLPSTIGNTGNFSIFSISEFIILEMEVSWFVHC